MRCGPGCNSATPRWPRDVQQRYDVELTSVGALGVSAMMHGYLAFDSDGELLTPFRTWRNTNTGEAAERLSAAFGHNIPHRWSVAHLYQAILNGEDHVDRIGQLTTLAGYVHWQLTGEKVLGIGDASGMFPIDIASGSYDAAMLAQFDQLAAEAGVDLRLADLLPTILLAGEPAGELTETGAKLLDPDRAASSRRCDVPAGGRCRDGHGGHELGRAAHRERQRRHQHLRDDRARARAQPSAPRAGPGHYPGRGSRRDGALQQRCQRAERLGRPVRGVRPGTRRCRGQLRRSSRRCSPSALDGAPDCGGLMSYNYLSGEPITELEEGRPLFLRSPDSVFNLATFMRTHLFASLATLRIGMDVLQKEEGVRLDRMFAHGGLFKTKGVAQRLPGGRHRHPRLGRRRRRRRWRLGHRCPGSIRHRSHAQTKV